MQLDFATKRSERFSNASNTKMPNDMSWFSSSYTSIVQMINPLLMVLTTSLDFTIITSGLIHSKNLCRFWCFFWWESSHLQHASIQLEHMDWTTWMGSFIHFSFKRQLIWSSLFSMCILPRSEVPLPGSRQKNQVVGLKPSLFKISGRNFEKCGNFISIMVE